MKITVRYFARLRETLGTSLEDIETDATDVAGLRRQLLSRGAPYDHALAPDQAIRSALNQQLCDGSAPLSPGAEVAFFPPVTGG
ncbi:MAG: molybdopterin converting factor subunit 1 [Alphaproteobacteria bacterium]|nr:molybdopterin converting factor subunit 1 [Alphaproteobacteria bacterium]